MAAWPYPQWIAHRGAGKLGPENTLAAFRLGAEYGYRAFECDVKLSADGQPFLLHDDTLDRTTGATGVAGQRAWSELSRLDAGSWHSRRFAGEPLASLEAVAAFIKGNGFALNIEIKPTSGTALHTGHKVGEAAERLWANTATPPLLSSFEPDSLQGAFESAPELPRALLLDKLWAGWFERAKGLQCRAVVTDYRLMSNEVVAQLHSAGLQALVYTVNDAVAAGDLIASGVDGLITDALDQFSPA